MEVKEQPKIKILVACHKADPNIRQDEVYMPIQVGKELHPELDLGFQCDNTGDNISAKNGSYCELTALYWGWKNLKDVDYIGLCHYRRYFDMDTSQENIVRTLGKYDCIILKRRLLRTNIVTELAELTSWEDTYIFIDELLNTVPEKKDLIFNFFYRSNKFTNCNMFIMKKDKFDNYCKFIFDVLSRVERKIKKNGYSRLNRVIGYLSEPLLGFWIAMNNYKVKEVDKDQSSELEQRKGFLSQISSTLRTEGSFILNNWSFRQPKISFFEEWILAGLRQDGVTIDNA